MVNFTCIIPVSLRFPFHLAQKWRKKIEQVPSEQQAGVRFPPGALYVCLRLEHQASAAP
jgi:hypothetical protein